MSTRETWRIGIAGKSFLSIRAQTIESHSLTPVFSDNLATPYKLVESLEAAMALYRLTCQILICNDIVFRSVKSERSMVYSVTETPYDGSKETVTLLKHLKVAITHNHIIDDAVAVRHADSNNAASEVSNIH